MTIKCILCQKTASASSYDCGAKARIYCTNCPTYDVTRQGLNNLLKPSTNRRKEIASRVSKTPNMKIYLIKRDSYVLKEFTGSMVDKPAPDWLLKNLKNNEILLVATSS